MIRHVAMGESYMRFNGSNTTRNQSITMLRRLCYYQVPNISHGRHSIVVRRIIPCCILRLNHYRSGNPDLSEWERRLWITPAPDVRLTGRHTDQLLPT